MINEINPESDCVPRDRSGWLRHLVFGSACALVIGIFAWGAEPGFRQLSHPDPADSYYNLLVQAFRAGQLNINIEAPSELARLSDPYNPTLNSSYIGNVYDMAYYRGKIYLYFGVAPVLTLLWPFAALTGHYLSDADAVVIFFSAGFLVAACILRSVWRRCFPETNVWVLAAGVLTFGAVIGQLEATSLWSDVYEVAANCAFAFTMLAVGTLWRALNDPKRPALWLFLASLAYGLAIASRPTMLFGAVILLTPAARVWFCAAGPKGSKHIQSLLAAAVAPLLCIGLGLMLYNFLRFRDPFEFGLHYQLQGDYDPKTAQQFSLRYLWFNLGFYFLEPMRLAGQFPFVRAFHATYLPRGYPGTGNTYGGMMIITSAVWMALATPFFWRKTPKDAALRWFMKAVFSLFVICAITTCLFFGASSRYELDFVPALMLLTVIGIFCLEKLARAQARRLVRWVWLALVNASLLLNVMTGIEAHAEANYFAGNFLVRCGQMVQAVPYFQSALIIEPRSANFHTGLGTAYFRQKRPDDAIVEYERAFECESNFPEAATTHNNLGYCLLEKNRVDDAILQFEKALEMEPGFAQTHNTLGDCFFQIGRTNEAIAEYEDAVKIQPDNAEAQNNLGYSLFLEGRAKEAIVHLQKASKIAPNNADFHYNLGFCLLQADQLDDAIVQFQKAIELRPHFQQAYQNLGEAIRRKGMPAQPKINHETANEINTNSAAGK